MDYTYKKTGNIFNAHSYWTKQPVNVIKEFLEKYSFAGDTILDPFCGTGMTGVCSIMNNRKYILSDISHVCLHISNGYCTEYNKDNIDKKIDELLDGIDHYYQTVCPKCGKKAEINFLILRDELEKQGRLEIDKVVYNCCDSKKQYKTPDNNDYKLFNCEDYKKVFYPKDYFFGQEPKRNYKRGIKQVYQLYSKRNISALSILWDRIIKLDDDNFKQLCTFAFSAILFNCSLLSRYSSVYENTKIKMGTYYIPYLIKDNNVVKSFRKKIKDILKANSEIFANAKTNGIIQFDDATTLSNVEDNSIDYIYTDPPYSDVLSYAELNLVYESWLGKKTNVDKEMIVSKAENKTINDYGHMFSDFLSNAYRVLKDNKYITIIFHNANVSHWKTFQESIYSSDFIPVCSEEPERLISNSKTSSQLSTGKKSQCFLAFTLQKKTSKKKNKLIELNNDEYQNVIEKLKDEAVQKGFINLSDQFDYVINRIIFKYKINDAIDI